MAFRDPSHHFTVSDSSDSEPGLPFSQSSVDYHRSLESASSLTLVSQSR